METARETSADPSGAPRSATATPWVLRTVAAVSEAMSAISGNPPLITRALLDDAAGGVPLFKIDKAKNDLGHSPRAAQDVVDATAEWARKMSWIS